jgi:hypothetical protein
LNLEKVSVSKLRFLPSFSQAAQLKVKEAEEKLRLANEALEAPVAATWVYWCTNFGTDAQSLADTVVAGSPIRALLHVKESLPTAETDPSKASTSEPVQGGSTESGATQSEPDLVKGLRALVASTTLDMPARQIAVVECKFKRPNVESSEAGIAAPADPRTNSKDTPKAGKPDSRPTTATKSGEKKPPKGGDKKAEKLGEEKDEGDELAAAAAVESLRAAARKVAQQAIAYEEYQARMKVVKVPAASADVDMSHYEGLLADIPPEDTTVPVMLHCMLEQVRSFSLVEKIKTKERKRELFFLFVIRVLQAPGCLVHFTNVLKSLQTLGLELDPRRECLQLLLFFPSFSVQLHVRGLIIMEKRKLWTYHRSMMLPNSNGLRCTVSTVERERLSITALLLA